MPSHYWIKLYHEILSDPKMGRLPDRTWRRAIELFLLAGDTANEGMLPPVTDIAWALRVPEPQLLEDLQALADVGIVTEGEKHWHVTNFGKRQAAVGNAQRQRQHRERQRMLQDSDEDVTEHKAERNGNVTNCNADIDTDKESDKEKKKNTSSSKRKEPSQKQQEAQAMFSALAEVCQIDLVTLTGTQRKQLNQSGLKLREADATPADMEPFATWWYANDWRGEKGDAPRPAQVRETWGKFKTWREGGQQHGTKFQSTNPRAPNYRPPLIGGLNA